MKRLLIGLSVFILLASIVYGLIAFQFLTINPNKWNDGARSLFAFFFVPLCGGFAILFINRKSL